MRTIWTNQFDDFSEQKKLEQIQKVCSLETINSVTKDDLLFMLRWLANETIVESDNETSAEEKPL